MIVTMARRSSRPLITSESLAELAPEWAALHSSIPSATPFTHPAWHATWLRHFGDGVEPVFLSVRREEPDPADAEATRQRLIGVFALTADRGLARTLGDANVRDYGGPIAIPGEEAAVAEGIIEWLLEDMTDGIELWGIAESGPMAPALAIAAESFGWECRQEGESVAPSVVLPASWDAFVAALGKHDRHELRRKLRHLESAGAVELRVAESPEHVTEAMTTLVHLMRVSRDDKDEFLTPRMEAFFRDLAATFAALGMVRLATLLLDGRAVASTLSFVHGPAQYLYNSGYEPDAAHLAVGLLSKALTIRAAIECGVERFDFLRGEEEYKRHLGGSGGAIITMRLGTAALRA
ncbi:hypothetical protein AYO38_07685 [bacterium SCGC AG-212-C10]|nr:hypothetical protein AYO38_07685 [bacterium SCGC AG-212-C10]